MPAGALSDGILRLQLEIRKGQWHPEADDGIALSVYAFGEVGHSLQNPGPLIRVPQGTDVRVSIRNTLAVPITVRGLWDPSGGHDQGVRIASGAVEQVAFKAETVGLRFYWGATEVDDVKLRYGVDSELTGALVVDPPGTPASDEIFVIEMISEHAGLASRKTVATVNGKSWPYTQRFEYDMGQAVRWRWVNATNEPHALHLHGFYFRIEAFNRGGHVERYEGDARPMVVTQRVATGETFDMSWSPDRPGRWLFHCHMLVHMMPPIVPDVPGLSMQPAAEAASTQTGIHDAGGMGQLVLGITVPERQPANAAWRPEHKVRLEISERRGIPRYELKVHDLNNVVGPEKPGLIGPPIVLTRGQPAEIEVVNQMQEPTAIHWHGIELESYYDGVPGWTGSNAEVTPAIAPGSSFVARMTPPRAGTFIYHTHWHDPAQLTNGIYGPLIVLPPGRKYDAASDLPFVFSIGDFDALNELALINGTPQSQTLQLRAGNAYRFRLINISTNNQAMQVSLRDAKRPVEWRVIAKDAVDLPPARAQLTKAQVTITVGETYDVEFVSDSAQELLLDLLLPGQKIHATQTLVFGPVPRSADKTTKNF
jgi:FtsP/CotA-like multicopper oxidase with cupredoxin domain